MTLHSIVVIKLYELHSLDTTNRHFFWKNVMLEILEIRSNIRSGL